VLSSARRCCAISNLAKKTVHALHMTLGRGPHRCAEILRNFVSGGCLGQFLAHHPNIRITLILNDTAAQASTTTDDFDVAIRLSPLSEGRLLRASATVTCRMAVCGPCMAALVHPRSPVNGAMLDLHGT
jgi:DNA-binding transcriptional LysR family regulator